MFDNEYNLTMSVYIGGPHRGYQQGNSYVYNNRSFKTNSSNNTNIDYSRISRQT